jgi:hypothetical protein
MDDVVPGVLQRLREADIVGLAGLAGASLGQEYCRNGQVTMTKRQGARLSGVVTLPDLPPEAERARQAESDQELQGAVSPLVQEAVVEIEVLSSTSCRVLCTCGRREALICTHAAALLYQWIHRPYTFVPLLSESREMDGALPGASNETKAATPEETRIRSEVPVRAPASPSSSRYAPLSSRRLPVNTIGETLAQIGLSELRSLAREYGVGVAGLSKQELIETMIETLRQPEAIRRVVAKLEKPQRQLLAAFALAGGSLSDEELRGLFERFSLGNMGTLQDMLVALQARLLIVRASFHQASQQRLHLSLPPLDISWYIPQEVREALHVTLPVTPFNVEVPYGKGANPSLPTLHIAEPYKLLADLLLIARALDGFPVEPAERRSSRSGSLLPVGRSSADGSLALPPPEDQPSPAMIAFLRASVRRSPAFLRFGVRLLRLADILYKEENGQTNLRLLPNAAQLLLGPARGDVLHDLFTHWLNRTSYAELFELSENGLRVRCRATPLNQPDLRRGELEQENNEARQELLALISQVPLGEWINFAAFARFIYRLRPTFLQRRQRLFPSPHWWIEQEEGHPLNPGQFSDWLRAEGRYLASLLQGPLHWWGLCDFALSTADQLLAFRLTPLAGQLFHGRFPSTQEEQATPSSPAPTALTISADGDLLIPCQPANWPLIAGIEDFAESRGVQDEMLRYSLTARSLGEAISQGRDLQNLLDLLDRSSSGESESAIQQLLSSMRRRIANYGRVRFYTEVSLLQTADVAGMQQLAAITSLEEQTIRSIQPTLLLLKKQGVEQLQDELKRRGQVPLLHEEV